MKGIFYLIGILALLTFEILKMYLIMPFPGSQEASNVQLAHFLHNNIWWIRILGLALVLPAMLSVFKGAKTYKKVLIVLPLALYSAVFYMCNYKFLAEVMFQKMETKTLLNPESNKIPVKNLIVGVALNGESRAYPIQIVGHHHQVIDTVGGIPVMVTYCTVCRTGRVYSPEINAKVETFRLAGMDQFNAMFEDKTTKSWWQQSTGECIAGKLKGQRLKEIFSRQMPLQQWASLHPDTKILQFDFKFQKYYDDLKGYDEGTIKGSLEGSELKKSNQKKSWVIGIINKDGTLAFDWLELKKKKSLQCGEVLAVISKDEATFAVFNTRINNEVLTFENINGEELITDSKTKSIWNLNGECIKGELANKKLDSLQSYQEFLHSWRSFHPQTEYCPEK